MNASALPAPRLPLTVVGGFLGSGKTTLLNRLLDQSAGRRLAVLVNDFGAINIDAAQLAKRDADTIALTNGCACCSIGDDLTSALIRVLEMQPRFDAVVIEASGVSDPWRIAQVGLADPALALDSVIVLVDAAAVLEQASHRYLTDTLQRQLRAADLIVVNKTDLVDAARLQRVRDWLATVAGSAPRFETTQASVPMQLLSGGAITLDGRVRTDVNDDAHREPDRLAARAGASGNEHDRDHVLDHDSIFESWSCRPARAFSAEALRALLRDMPDGVLRLKGILRTDDHGWAELQFAGRHGSLRKALTVPATGAALVAVGLRHRLPAQVLNAFFNPGETA